MTNVDALKKFAAAYMGGGLTADRIPGKTIADVIDYIARFELGEQLTELTVASSAGATVGTTSITVEPELTSGNSYKYQTSPSSIDTPDYLSDATGYTTWDGTSDITAEDGHYVGIYEVNGDNQIVKFGQSKASVNLG